jgi:integrase
MRSFIRICSDNGIRLIRVHATRRTTASLLKGIGVPARDAQVILGHSHISTTQQIYTHVDEVARREALTKLNKLLGGANEPPTVVNLGGQPPVSPSQLQRFA